MRLPNWLRRRRRFQVGRWTDDRDACFGADGLEAAVNWMQFVLGRDCDGMAVNRCVIVAEVGEGHEARTVYTTHDVDTTPVEVRGLLEEGLRALDELRVRAFRQADIEQYINQALPQVVEALEAAMFGRAHTVVQNLNSALADEAAIEAAGARRLREELVERGCISDLRKVAFNMADQFHAQKIRDLADELDQALDLDGSEPS